jgi:hypothetical protein
MYAASTKISVNFLFVYYLFHTISIVVNDKEVRLQLTLLIHQNYLQTKGSCIFCKTALGFFFIKAINNKTCNIVLILAWKIALS